MNIRIALLLSIAALSFAGAASAQTGSKMADMPGMNEMASSASAPGAASALSTGEIRKVDKESKKLTIKHGPLTNLDMPGMTMVFGVADEAMLDKFQNGQKVRFEANKINGQLLVTRIEAAG